MPQLWKVYSFQREMHILWRKDNSRINKQPGKVRQHQAGPNHNTKRGSEMAQNTISQHTPTVKESSAIHLEFIGENRPAVLSTEVALRFQKKHQHVLRDIDKICSILPKEFTASNFGRMLVDVKIGNGAVRQSPAFLLTRDAFSLLVMGFTGAAAVRWKLKYIEALNALEAEALEHRAELAREAGYQQGVDETRSLPVILAGRQGAYLEGMKEGKRLAESRDGLKLITRAQGYLAKGLTRADTARLLGISRQYLHRLLKRATALGI